MTIYRGPGGAGNADSDAEITELTALTNQALAYSEAAALEADAAAVSAAAASTSAASAATSASGAATSATNASNSASAASTSATNAAASASSASTSASSASTSATNAASSASAASTSATNAATSETNAAASAATATTQAGIATTGAGTATTQASNAATSASAAAGSATTATTQATNAATSATNAATSATSASTSATSAASSYDAFDDRYLGSKTSAPSLDNDGNALLTGALYWNSTSNELYLWTGSAWTRSALTGADYVAKAGDTMTGALNVAVSTSSNALRITQLGTGNALLVEDSANPDATPFVIDASGNVGIGATTASFPLHVIGQTAGSPNILGLELNAAATPGILVRRSNGTNASKTTVGDGSGLLNLSAQGFDGTNYISAATITAAVDGVPGTNDMPGRLVFSTTADGASSPTERVRIDSAGNVGVGTSSPGATKLNVVSNVAAQATVANFGQSFAALATDVQWTNANNTTSTTLISKRTDGGLWLYQSGANYIATYTNGTERMRVDSAGNVGIGTSSPSKKLDVVGQFRVSGSAASGYALIEYGTSATSTNNWHSGSEGDGSFRWYNGTFGAGTERMRITGTGNVGINATPTTTFQIGDIGAADATYQGRIKIEDASTSLETIGGLEFTTSAFGSGYGWKMNAIDATGVHLVFGSRQNSATWTERMRIDSSGNLGIGTTAPTVPLHIYRASGNTTMYLQSAAGIGSLLVNAAGDMGIANTVSGRTLEISQTGVGTITFVNNGSERMRVTDTGILSVGTTTPSASAIIDAQSTTRGVRMPNMTTTQKNAIASPAAGLMVFDTTLAKLCVYTGAAWQTITSA